MRDFASVTEWLDKGEYNTTYYLRNRKTPLLLASLFTEIARYLYLGPDGLYPTVRPWDPENKCNEDVYIESSNIWKETETDRRPAIIVDVGDLRGEPNKYQGIDRRYGFDLREGEAFYERRLVSSVVFAHRARIKGQAVTYASNTYDLVDAFGRNIMADFGFDGFDFNVQTKARRISEKPEDWESLVQFDFIFREGFSVKTESPKLKRISMDVIVGQ